MDISSRGVSLHVTDYGDTAVGLVVHSPSMQVAQDSMYVASDTAVILAHRHACIRAWCTFRSHCGHRDSLHTYIVSAELLHDVF